MPINQENFDTTWSLFQNAVFVIPTFQRPYAWDEAQFKDLVNDIKYTSSVIPSEHYLSPIHVIKIANSDQDEWLKYTDESNPHVMAMTNSQFRDANGIAYTIYLVVDGQQRLATLFMLFYTRFDFHQNLFIELSTSVGDKIRVPRLILNPKNDHLRFCQLLKIPNQAPNPPPSRSQKRLSKIFQSCREEVNDHLPIANFD